MFANRMLRLIFDRKGRRNKGEEKTTRVIQKIISVCEYCRCSAADTMVPMRAEIGDSVARHRRNLQILEQSLRILQCVYNV